jgi:16S rRNA (cytosine967-C5)-methyltransferase
VTESPRALIAQTLVAIMIDHENLDASLDKLRERNRNPNTSAFIQESVFAVTRRYYELEALLKQFLTRPLRDRDQVIKMLLLAALNEILHMRTAPYAAVDESVTACLALERPWAKGLVNGVLRAVLRAKPTQLIPQDSPEVRWNHPQWLIDHIKRDWPAHSEQILNANNAHPPLTLRVNLSRITRTDYIALLDSSGMAAEPTRHAASGVMLRTPCPVAALPGFVDGLVSVQDEAAQLAAPLLGCLPSHRVLDACAAPGGKTTHLLESCPGIELTAVEINGRRLVDVEENLARLGLTCTLKQLDVTTLGATVAPHSYDRILLDAPCSASGVIRRHPDVRFHRTEADIARAALRQCDMLNALWPLLAPGGQMIYATCSTMHAENDAVISGFLAARPNAADCQPIDAEWGHATDFGRQILPGEADMDGFYFARIAKPNTDPS